MNQRCSICRGNGKIEVLVMGTDTDMVTCDHCDGTGIEPPPPNAEKIFYWIDGYTGEAAGGFHIRDTSFHDFMNRLKKNGLTPVGIVYNGTPNLEIILARDQAYMEKYEKDKAHDNDSQL